MMIAALLLLFLLMLGIKSPFLSGFGPAEQSTSLALGFILLFAYLVGRKIQRLKLPQITGFLLAGLLCGPYLLKLLKAGDVADLQLLDGLALSLIALTAGGEMKIQELRHRMKAVSLLVLFQTLLIIGGFLLLGLVLRPFFPLFSNFSPVENGVFFLLLGTLATATSPSTTIAVINESRAEGPNTNLVLSTAVFKDFFVIILFAFSLSFSKPLIEPGKGFDIGFLWHILRDIGGSFALGLLVGIGMILYLKFIRRDLTIFVLAVAFFTYQISHNYGFHPLLICLLAGFLVENYSPHGLHLIRAIEKSSLPVYVIFFAISGASLDLNALRSSWLLALIFVVWRGGLKFTGTYLGARFAGEDPAIRTWGWTGFISQAGVALGMAIIVERTFPEWGAAFKALVLAVIAINQIIGPVLLQTFLFRVGEAGKKRVER